MSQQTNFRRSSGGTNSQKTILIQTVGVWQHSLTVAECVCGHVLKRVLKPSTHRLQIFLVKYEYMRSLQPCEDQGIS